MCLWQGVLAGAGTSPSHDPLPGASWLRPSNPGPSRWLLWPPAQPPSPAGCRRGSAARTRAWRQRWTTCGSWASMPWSCCRCLSTTSSSSSAGGAPRGAPGCRPAPAGTPAGRLLVVLGQAIARAALQGRPGRTERPRLQPKRVFPHTYAHTHPHFTSLPCSPNPRDHMVNVWGYSHLNFFAPMSRFGSSEGLLLPPSLPLPRPRCNLPLAPDPKPPLHGHSPPAAVCLRLLQTARARWRLRASSRRWCGCCMGPASRSSWMSCTTTRWRVGRLEGGGGD